MAIFTLNDAVSSANTLKYEQLDGAETVTSNNILPTAAATQAGAGIDKRGLEGTSLQSASLAPLHATLGTFSPESAAGSAVGTQNLPGNFGALAASQNFSSVTSALSNPSNVSQSATTTNATSNLGGNIADSSSVDSSLINTTNNQTTINITNNPPTNPPGDPAAARANRKAAEFNLKNTELEVDAARLNAQSNFTEASRRLEESQRARTESAKVINNLANEVKQGNRTVRDLLDAKRDELAAANAWAQAYANKALVGYDLERWQ